MNKGNLILPETWVETSHSFQRPKGWNTTLINFIFDFFKGGRQKWVPLNLEGAEGAAENSSNDAVSDKSPTSPEAASPTAVNTKPAKSPTGRFNSGGMPGNMSPVRGNRGGRGGMRGGRGNRGRQRSPRGNNVSCKSCMVYLAVLEDTLNWHTLLKHTRDFI